MRKRKSRNPNIPRAPTKAPEYRVYTSAKNNCYNPNNPQYKFYGGRGIEFCEEWKDSYDQFYYDMGPRPSNRYFLTREDKSGPYSPENCSWKIGSRARGGKPRTKPEGIPWAPIRCPEYIVWQNAKQRCYNENHPAYPTYGGRGIKMCEEWKESYDQFYYDMGPRPSANYSIDRRDTNQGYNPDNCYWATWEQQAATASPKYTFTIPYRKNIVRGRRLRAVRFLERCCAQGIDLIELLYNTNQRNRYIVERRLQGITLAEIGKEIGVSRERIRQIEKEILEVHYVNLQKRKAFHG